MHEVQYPVPDLCSFPVSPRAPHKEDPSPPSNPSGPKAGERIEGLGLDMTSNEGTADAGPMVRGW